MENKAGIYKYYFGDAEVEIEGYLRLFSGQNLMERAKAVCMVGDEEIEVEFIISEDQLAHLLIDGQIQTYYSDWD